VSRREIGGTRIEKRRQSVDDIPEVDLRREFACTPFEK
jgi:hypothetical protein